MITAYTDEDGTEHASEVTGAQAIYEPEWEPGRRRRQPRRPKQLCMQVDSTTLQQQLQESRAGEASQPHVCIWAGQGGRATQ